jgi:hypothetical protein
MLQDIGRIAAVAIIATAVHILIGMARHWFRTAITMTMFLVTGMYTTVAIITNRLATSLITLATGFPASGSACGNRSLVSV